MRATIALILALMFAVLISGCGDNIGNVTRKEAPRYSIVVIDSCEYIEILHVGLRGGITHKGNCKYCKERK
jgi:hypothetical protein